MTINSNHWNLKTLEEITRNSDEWFRFVKWQQERILERLQRYNNTETVKIQLVEHGDLTPYQRYKITTVSKYLLQALDLIKSGDYGTCTSCHHQIPAWRLLLVPGALRCMDCENKKP